MSNVVISPVMLDYIKEFVLQRDGFVNIQTYEMEEFGKFIGYHIQNIVEKNNLWDSASRFMAVNCIININAEEYQKISLSNNENIKSIVAQIDEDVQQLNDFLVKQEDFISGDEFENEQFEEELPIIELIAYKIEKECFCFFPIVENEESSFANSIHGCFLKKKDETIIIYPFYL